MAVQSKKPSKEEESKAGKRPDFIIRARTEPGNDASFKTIGAVWEVEVRGERAYSVKLHSIPLNWDGSCLMLAPKDE